MVENLYVHFPFCRRKCAYCALYSRAGASESDRADYVRRIAAELSILNPELSTIKTLYFGGGSPALCDLTPLGAQFSTLKPDVEFTVELHPLDVSEMTMKRLRDLGVNRISMGMQSFSDAVLADMGRGYTVAEAVAAFRQVKRHFDNVGIDLIVGYPGRGNEADGLGLRWKDLLRRFSEMGMRHCSVYSLQNERGLMNVPDDNVVLDGIRAVADRLRELGLERYEISNYAVPGFECRHNLAVWRGEDYVGVGEGACGRVGLTRTVGRKSGVARSTVTPEEDCKERTIFRLRTREGLDASGHPEWGQTLRKFAEEGLLTQDGRVFRLTSRGTEVCDSILEALV